MRYIVSVKRKIYINEPSVLYKHITEGMYRPAIRILQSDDENCQCAYKNLCSHIYAAMIYQRKTINRLNNDQFSYQNGTEEINVYDDRLKTHTQHE